MDKITLCCLRDHDLRLSDNPALNKALDYANSHQHRLVLCVFIEDNAAVVDGVHDSFSAGSIADHYALVESLSANNVAYARAIFQLNTSIESLGGALNISFANITHCIEGLSRQYHLDGVFWNRRYTPNGITQDAQLKQFLTQHNIYGLSKNAALLFEPFDSRSLKKDGSAYKVFTPFANNLLKTLASVSNPLPSPQSLEQTIALQTRDIHRFQPQPTNAPRWAKQLLSHWSLTEQHAAALIDRLQLTIDEYATSRNIPALAHGTSKLSPYLRLGICSPKQILHAIMHDKNKNIAEDRITFIKEILWREYAYHMLYHFPDTVLQPFKSRFINFPWRIPSDNDAGLIAWQTGQTGVPIVDAGMRELWATGWMHNRVRMIVASWLTKNMGIHWRVGASWFMHTLIDADLASNTFGWQWVAGCGLDAAPYFRVFNPTLQAKKFDPHAKYLKKWLPELRDMPSKHCFEPWQYSNRIAKPIIDIAESRQQALAMYKTESNID